MPPKKAAPSSMVGEYDIELMTEEELRKYIEALQEEHLRMRKARSLCHRDKHELLNNLKCLQENIIEKEKIEMQESLEIQEILTDAEQKSKFEDVLNKIKELENNNEDEKNKLESFIKVKTVEILNKEEEDNLARAIVERDREIQEMEHILKQTLIQSKENRFEKYFKSSENCKNNFEKFVNFYNENFIKLIKEFSQNKIEKLQDIWEDISDKEINSFTNIVSEMSIYFKDIYWKNIKTADKLRCTLTNIKKELNTVTLNLNDITKENNQLRSGMDERFLPRSSPIRTSSFTVEKAKSMQELTYENYLLSIKLELLNKEYSDLKEKFVFALRRIHQQAVFKALLLTKQLSAVQNCS